ncbi:MAG: DNA polymerase III subunit delta [Oscillospiraceae bacterium]|jgi:DNA polymerase-3 subunit delta|nr:DNA polymerase III subunit delta [Oscillospiraceae bacterium]
MPLISEKELRQREKSGNLGGVFFIYGEDSYRSALAVKALQKAAGGEGGFASRSFAGKEVDLDDVAEAVTTVSLSGGGVCVTVRDLAFDALSDGQVKKLKELTQLVPPESTLIFWHSASEIKKTARTRSLIKLFTERGHVLDCEKMTARELEKVLSEGAKRRGCHFAPGVVGYLVQSVGTELNLLQHELEKLCDYAAGKGADAITAETVDALCAKTVEATAFDLTRALLAGERARALKLLESLFAQRVEPLMILGAMNTSFIDLYQVKLAQMARCSTSELAQLLPGMYKGREFRLRNAGGRASALSLPRLRACLKYLAEADTLLKSAPAPARPLLERTVLSLGLALAPARR